jgi:hypothetical protein
MQDVRESNCFSLNAHPRAIPISRTAVARALTRYSITSRQWWDVRLASGRILFQITPMNSSIEGLCPMPPISVTRNDSFPRSMAIRDIIDATRFICTLTKQLPLQPLLAALAVSFRLGAIPMVLTVFYAAIRELSDRCPAVSFPHRERPLDQGSEVRQSGNHSSLLHDSAERTTAFAIADESVTASLFDQRLNHPELL